MARRKLAILFFLLNVYSSHLHVLDEVPLIDGHNDLPYNIWTKAENNFDNVDLSVNLTMDTIWGLQNCSSCHTDLPRMRQGKVGAQFWVAYTPCSTQYRDTVAWTLEQIDVIKRFIRKYPSKLQFATDADGIMSAFNDKKIASLIGIEGGHSIDSRFGVLRMMYELGARYMTLTHTCQTPWADSAMVDTKSPVHNLTEFGKEIVKEMNRLGMLVDLSHVSHNVMNEAINASRSPVIFSHSGAWSVCNHIRNVHDDTLKLLKENNGIIMVNFYSEFISSNPKNASIYDVLKHINHIVDIIGFEHVGLGSDFDGVSMVPKGLEDVSKYPAIFDLLAKENATRWTDENLKKIAGLNFLRVFKDVEKTRDQLTTEEPRQEWISRKDLLKVEEQELLQKCTTLLDDKARNSANVVNVGLGTILTGLLVSYVKVFKYIFHIQ